MRITLCSATGDAKSTESEAAIIVKDSLLGGA